MYSILHSGDSAPYHLQQPSQPLLPIDQLLHTMSPSPSHPGYLPLHSYTNRMYTTTVQLGTPPQSFHVVVDSGSSDLWLFNKHSNVPHQSFINYYDSTRSSTFIDSMDMFQLQYGKGRVQGTVGMDQMILGQYKLSNITFGLVNEYSNDFTDSLLPLDGILGIGPDQLSSIKSHAYTNNNMMNNNMVHSNHQHHNAPLTVLQSLQQQYIGSGTNVLISLSVSLPYVILGYNGDQRNNTDNDDTQFIVPTSQTHVDGNTDSSHQLQSITVPTTTHRRWSIPIDSIAIDNDRLGDMCDGTANNQCTGLIDTGTSFITLSPTLYHIVTSEIIQYRNDCSITTESVYCNELHNDHLPTLGFVIDQQQVIITPSQYKQQHIIGIMSLHTARLNDNNLMILGDTFLYALHSVQLDYSMMAVTMIGNTHALHTNTTRHTQLIPYLSHHTVSSAINGHHLTEWLDVYTVLILFGVLFVMLCIGVPLYIYCMRQHKSNMQSHTMDAGTATSGCGSGSRGTGVINSGAPIHHSTNVSYV